MIRCWPKGIMWRFLQEPLLARHHYKSAYSDTLCLPWNLRDTHNPIPARSHHYHLRPFITSQFFSTHHPLLQAHHCQSSESTLIRTLSTPTKQTLRQVNVNSYEASSHPSVHSAVQLYQYYVPAPKTGCVFSSRRIHLSTYPSYPSCT